MLDCIAPGPDDIVLPKTSASVFISTSLDYILRSLGKRQARARGRARCGRAAGAALLMSRPKGRSGLPLASHLSGCASQVVLAGALTDQCVEGAVRDACDLQYLVTLVSGARAILGPVAHSELRTGPGAVPVASKQRALCRPCFSGRRLQVGECRGPGPALVRVLRACQARVQGSCAAGPAASMALKPYVQSAPRWLVSCRAPCCLRCSVHQWQRHACCKGHEPDV